MKLPTSRPRTLHWTVMRRLLHSRGMSLGPRTSRISVSFDSADPSTLYIDIRYTIGNTNDPRNLVFPFYVIPSEEPVSSGVPELTEGE